ncbi:hypothetical protein Tco_1151389, partial [Tanacetum coccineum]
LGDCEMDEKERSWDSKRELNLLWSVYLKAFQEMQGVDRGCGGGIKMGRMEIRQEAIERMEYRQSYHWDRYQRVFEHMAGVYSVPMQGAYNPPCYAQPQYDQYYQKYPPLRPQYQQQQDDE